MSQRSSGHVPLPDEPEWDRASADAGAFGYRPARRTTGYRRREPAAWDHEGMDPLELDRYLEDRARLAGSTLPPPAREDQPPASARSGSRWSSADRRRGREQARPAPVYLDEPVDRAAASLRGPAPPSRSSQPYAGSDGPENALYDPADPYIADEELADYGYAPALRPSRRTRRAARPRPTVVMPRVRVPTAVRGADLVHDPVALALVGGSAVLVAVTALLTLSRVGDLPPAIELRFDAGGSPVRWGPPRSLWQLPLLATMVTLINLVLAAAVSRGDRFASRFLLASALLIALLTLVPLGRFLF